MSGAARTHASYRNSIGMKDNHACFLWGEPASLVRACRGYSGDRLDPSARRMLILPKALPPAEIKG